MGMNFDRSPGRSGPEEMTAAILAAAKSAAASLFEIQPADESLTSVFAYLTER